MPDLGFAFTWYGHACVEIGSRAGTRVIVDPWFGNPRSTKAAADVDACDVLLVTHGHADHLGGSAGDAEAIDALTIAAHTAPAWPCIHEMSLWLGGATDTRGLADVALVAPEPGVRVGWPRARISG